MELTLSGCSITHIPKDGKKKKHELKIVHQGADALVLAVQSKEQAEEWLKVKPLNLNLHLALKLDSDQGLICKLIDTVTQIAGGPAGGREGVLGRPPENFD